VYSVALWRFERYLTTKPPETTTTKSEVPQPVQPVPLEKAQSANNEKRVAITHLRFKDSPIFTAKRKSRIEANISKIDLFFKRIEIDVPTDIPRIGVNMQATTGTGSSSSISPQHYQESIDIPVNQIDDPEKITLSYCQYVIWKMLVSSLPPTPQEEDASDKRDFSTRAQEYWSKPELIDSNYRHWVAMTVPIYLNWSFWNRKGTDHDSPCDKKARLASEDVPWPIPVRFFWSIREKYGRSFADQLVAYTLKEMRDNPHTDPKEKFHAYFIDHLRRADSLIDNEQGARFPEIERLLETCPWEK